MSIDFEPKHMSHAICPGCITYGEVEKVRDVQNKDGHYDTPKCAIRPYHNGVFCPCSTCLVKMVCEDTCDRLTEYKERYLYGGDFTRPIPK